MEITFYLTLLKIPDDQALRILIMLFKDYEVQRLTIETVYFTHRQYTQAIIETKVNSSVRQNRHKEACGLVKCSLAQILLQVSQFLVGDSAYFELLRLNKGTRDQLKVEIFGNFLMRNPQIGFEDRCRLHYIMIPDKYHVS